MNSWDDAGFVAAIQKTGRRKIVLSGLWTETCVALPAIQALAMTATTFYVVEDCCGDIKLAGAFECDESGHSGWRKASLGAVGAARMAADWALKETYESVMDIAKNPPGGAYGVGVEYAYTMVHKAPATTLPEYVPAGVQVRSAAQRAVGWICVSSAANPFDLRGAARSAARRFGRRRVCSSTSMDRFARALRVQSASRIWSCGSRVAMTICSIAYCWACRRGPVSMSRSSARLSVAASRAPMTPMAGTQDDPLDVLGLFADGRFDVAGGNFAIARRTPAPGIRCSSARLDTREHQCASCI